MLRFHFGHGTAGYPGWSAGTRWRSSGSGRAHGSVPGLPLALPLELGRKAGQAEAGIRALAGADPAARAGLALGAARQIAGLSEACASAAALTQAADAAAGDRDLWESVTGTLHRAGQQALGILLQVSDVTDWSLEDEPEGGPGTWLRLRIG